ncbi:putative leucine-rich repeat domain, L domain-containing protein [Lupinus albus]|uniref:Putative leucine-rich repeat domain, L domain-containing protein n=1 Tax=Lupinus albus TaxID=3870 RepID=A0A6A4R347_LUPAL|nr:putative leucine-rich repeat domain, L domain-containing protein [Lupinus albus]
MSTCPFKSVTFHNIINITNGDLILIAQCFSSIQQLDISSYCSCDQDVIDIGIRALPIGLTKLRKVLISGYFINDSKLVILCKHYPLLEKVIITCDKFITQHVIASAIMEMLNLISFSVKIFKLENNSPDLIVLLMGLRNMTFLDLSFMLCKKDGGILEI